jgi:hypothetical protein
VAGLRDLASGPWRVSAGSLLSALIAAGIMGAMVVPAATAQKGDALVLANRGGDYSCQAQVAVSGRIAHVPCGEAEPGETVEVDVLGWPRSGEASKPADDAAIGASMVVVVLIGLKG